MRHLTIITAFTLIFLGACSDPSASKQAVEAEAKADLLKQQQEIIKLEAKAKEQAEADALAQQKLAEVEAGIAKKAAIALDKKRAEYDQFKQTAIDAAKFAEQTANDQKTALETAIAEAKKNQISDPIITKFEDIVEALPVIPGTTKPDN
ncbi:MAG: hypothetical protein COA60_009755 [Robiginitomaculum sp.]|nr:hypothetical protein [Robiginitomaculum sp.]